MDFTDSPEEAAFRQELQAWLAANAPKGPLPRPEEERIALMHRWHGQLYEAGWLGAAWPAEYGGRGLGPIFGAILNEELGRAGAPPQPPIGFLGRAVLYAGSDEQKRRYIPPLLSGEEQWCQGYSEPGAGSDLAALSTRAVLDGDVYRVSGQKVWTSFAQWADWCLLLARTDPDVPKHKGISTFMVRMDSPGIEVRPIVQMTGDREFSEVFFDDVVVPASQMVGAPGSGWETAMATLEHERGPDDIGFTARYRIALGRIEERVRAGELVLSDDGRAALAAAHVQIEALRIHVLRSLTTRARGESLGPVGSVDKQLMSSTEQALHRTLMDLLGAEPLLDDGNEWLHDYLYSRAASIYGGTAQIQRNILAQRVLGLPRD